MVSDAPPNKRFALDAVHDVSVRALNERKGEAQPSITDPATFYIEYSEGDIHGRLTIGGKTSVANYYSLEATLEETSGAKGK